MADPEANAYSLLTKPTLELTDAEVEVVVTDLRKRRLAYVNSNTKDTPKAPKAAATPLTAEEKAMNTRAVAASLNLDDFDI